MCIAVWTLSHPSYALVLAANRDEHLDRPTVPAQFHNFGEHNEGSETEIGHILSGVDTRAGGTWFGVNRSGDVGLLTNITETPRKWTSSRGHLVSRFLLHSHAKDGSEDPLHDFIDVATSNEERYAGFNLVLFSPTKSDNPEDRISYKATLLTNHGGGGDIVSKSLDGLTANSLPSQTLDKRGTINLGCVSNGAENLSEWPKVKKARQSLQEILDEPHLSEEDLTERLFQLLQWEPPVKPEKPRDTILVAPIHIPRIGSNGLYATRLSSIILITHSGDVLFIERDIFIPGDAVDVSSVPRAPSSSQRVFRFRI
ncbi:DUF833-domain-containing protein [Sistotremastrum niveocremeum HHB9708]|uniref:DUF833-domain-containing protein n=1 Tax=Sistotremastrum niveocremeum HHB9708 TaxID=1314777 RepID=A0A164ZZ73_9AGAM|nr:DUF833-domain-containing protein [Sistotremastrum niveocremeum HHB9708]